VGASGWATFFLFFFFFKKKEKLRTTFS
jgi:hypothetical protein